jgi:phosphatidylinositol dimannoside acyltransferase
VSRTAARERLAYWVYRAVRWVARTMPERTGRRTFETLAELGYLSLPGVRATVRRNQAQVLGLPASDRRVEASTRQAFRLYGRYWQETFLVPTWTDREVLERFTCDGFEHMQAALAAGRGAIAALPHLGNWDVAGRWMATMGLPVVSVAEELRPAELFDMFVQNRRELGIEVLPLSSNGHVGRQLASALTANRVVALVADRHLGGRGVDVEMFGRTRRMPAGPAMLSLATGAPLIPTPVYTTDRGWHLVMHEPITIEPTGERKEDAEALTRRLAVSFERAIAAAPADWHLFLPGWEP